MRADHKKLVGSVYGPRALRMWLWWRRTAAVSTAIFLLLLAAYLATSSSPWGTTSGVVLLVLMCVDVASWWVSLFFLSRVRQVAKEDVGFPDRRVGAP